MDKRQISPANETKSSKYVPPHLRVRSKSNSKREPTKKINKINFSSNHHFPSLNGNESEYKDIFHSNKKSFVDTLAKETIENNKNEEDKLPWGWIKIKKDGTIVNSLTPEEQKEQDDRRELERQQIILDEMREIHYKRKKERHEDELYGYISTDDSCFSDEECYMQNDENSVENDDELSDY